MPSFQHETLSFCFIRDSRFHTNSIPEYYTFGFSTNEPTSKYPAKIVF